jgi:hypothetical protein
MHIDQVRGPDPQQDEIQRGDAEGLDDGVEDSGSPQTAAFRTIVEIHAKGPPSDSYRLFLPRKLSLSPFPGKSN